MKDIMAYLVGVLLGAVVLYSICMFLDIGKSIDIDNGDFKKHNITEKRAK